MDAILGEVVLLEQWPNVVLLYDESYSRKRALNIKDKIQKLSKEIRFHEVKLFLESDRITQPTLLSQRFDDIMEDGEFFNFIILATRNNTAKIIAMAEKRQVNGRLALYLVC